MNVCIISPFKEDFIVFKDKILKNKDNNINIIYAKNRFEYLKFIKENNSIFFIRDFNIFNCEKYLLQNFNNFIFYSDINKLKNENLLDNFYNFELNESILNELYFLAYGWDNIIYSYLGKLFPGFIHNISSPITALSGKFSIAKLVNKSIEVDDNLTNISDKILQLIRNFQFVFESLNYLEPQNINIVNFINEMKEVFNTNLKFKHNIKLIINNKETFSNFTVLPYLVFFYLYLISKLIEFVGDNKITLFIDILKENERKYVYFKFDFDGEFEFINFDSVDKLDFTNLEIEKIYLLWNYLIPENIIINTYKNNNVNIVKIIYS